MIKDKIVYVLQRDGVVQNECWTTLKGCCDAYGLPYGSAIKGKRAFAIRNKTFFISEVYLSKVSGRENNHKGKRK